LLFVGVVTGALLAAARFGGAPLESDPVVGAAGLRRWIVPTNQVITPAGLIASFAGRPVDAAFLDDTTLAVKSNDGILLVDLATATVRQRLKDPLGAQAVTGLVVRASDRAIFTSATAGAIRVARPGSGGRYAWADTFILPAPAAGGDPAPTGLALDEAGRRLMALSGRGNTLHVLDADTGAPLASPIAVGVAPFGVVLGPGGKVYVSNWGGEPPNGSDHQDFSSGTPVKTDPRTGAAADGSVSVVDFWSGRTVKAIRTGLHPSGLSLGPDGRFLYVACANSDEVDVIDTNTDAISEVIPIRPVPDLPFGSSPTAVIPSPDGGRLYVALGTNNAVAVVALSPSASSAPETMTESRIIELIPAGWYPGALAVAPAHPERRLPADPGSPRGFSHRLFVVNVKGQGTLSSAGLPAHNSHDYLGSVSMVLLPHSPAVAERFTETVAENNRQAAALLGLGAPRPGTPPRPIPERHGEPSPIRHVLYVIKENRSYDQVFGDLSQGNGDPSLLMFGREVTPNQHALAEEFVLLDNFYCSGVLSADGHAWATQAFVTDYLERQFGGWVRSYPYEGGDPLAYSSAGFLWDGALAKGLSFRDYGEMVHAEIVPQGAAWRDLYDDYRNGTSLVTVRAHPGVPTLEGHFCPTFVGFPGTVPDVYRAREFLREFRQFEASGELPSLMVMLLPNDHTAALVPGMPSPRAMVADNDLALGQIVEAISHSRFWPETAIFVVEDDPQDGLDHVDGHRTIAQVISPYTRRGTVDHGFYTQIGMLKTIELILGLPPLNQLDLAAPPMRSCFREEPDPTPFVSRLNQVPLDEMNPSASRVTGRRLFFTRKSMELPLDEVDEADEETLNRILWYATRGDTPYPARPDRGADEP
jgi:YVTN family beta-propeller protein